jgi:hypothetical protein
MSDPATLAMLTVGLQGANLIKGIGDSNNAKNAQESAAATAAANAKATATAADQAYNKANPKLPSTNSLDAANKLYGSQGVSSTSLTGPGGVDQATLTLGKKTLLGS